MLDIIYREKTNQQTANRYRMHTVLGAIIWTIPSEDDSIQLLVSIRFFSLINQPNTHIQTVLLYDHICTYDYIIITLFSIEGYPKINACTETRMTRLLLLLLSIFYIINFLSLVCLIFTLD